MDSRQFEINELIDYENYHHSFHEDQPNENKIEETLNNIFMSNADDSPLLFNNKQNSSRKQSFEETTFGNSYEGTIKQKPKTKKANLKLFICLCGKVYKSKENQTLHYKNIHLNVKPYKCSFCDSKFSHRNGKTYHERKFHTFILPYNCPQKSCKQFFF